MKPGSPSPQTPSLPGEGAAISDRIRGAAPKRNKYGNKRTQVDGIWFASKREATRYSVLRIAQRGGLIRELELQKRYPLEVKGVKIGTYVCDFRYIEDGIPVVEDCKGAKTQVYKLKKKLMKAIYEIEVRET